MNKLNWWKMAFAVSLLCAATAIAVPAQTFTKLYDFCSQGACTDGTNPNAGLVQAIDGNLYGTTEAGGPHFYGTAFRISPSGTLKTLYDFCSQSECVDGGTPLATPVQATDGNLYGTTSGGGADDGGTVYKVGPNGTLKTVYNFCSQSDCTDGFDSNAALIEAADGSLYGTNRAGGTEDKGTVFKITPSGALTALYSFCSLTGCTDGDFPTAALVLAADGSFYGTTYGGGVNGGGGTVFKITSTGTLTTLYSFCSQSDCRDGDGPNGALVQATDGNFYGTTREGGVGSLCVGGCGTIFKMTPSGALTTLHRFNSTDGTYPATLIQATDGDFYGTTFQGGDNASGTIFKIGPTGMLTTLYSFDGADGSLPEAALLQDTNGDFYGTTYWGGLHGDGTVFSLSVGLGPFVETLPTLGKVGRSVIILGTNLTGATSVTFNGTAATFRVVSKSAISTTVPAGATTGKVQVVTPSGTLSSNMPFRVAP